MSYDSTQDTKTHIARVAELLKSAADRLIERGRVHDKSKLQSPEKEEFDRLTPLLKSLTYGSDEYKESLRQLGFALKNHYANNSHHPEFYPNGINGMCFLDLVEMLCDWKAATERHDNGNFAKSLFINRDRFKIEPQLFEVICNTSLSLNFTSEDEIYLWGVSQNGKEGK